MDSYCDGICVRLWEDGSDSTVRFKQRVRVGLVYDHEHTYTFTHTHAAQGGGWGDGSEAQGLDYRLNHKEWISGHE